MPNPVTIGEFIIEPTDGGTKVSIIRRAIGGNQGFKMTMATVGARDPEEVYLTSTVGHVKSSDLIAALQCARDMAAEMKDGAKPVEVPEPVMVCDACGSVACWNGNFMCENARTAGVIEQSAYRAKGLEDA